MRFLLVFHSNVKSMLSAMVSYYNSVGYVIFSSVDNSVSNVENFSTLFGEFVNGNCY